MKKYFFTIFLVLLLIFLSLLVLKDKKGSSLINLPSSKNNKVDNSQKNQKSETASINNEKISIEQGLTLELTSPKDQETVSTPVVTVTGKTSPNAEVFINEKELKADSFGNFSVSYELYEGENSIYVAVNDEDGNYAEKTLTVYLETTE